MGETHLQGLNCFGVSGCVLNILKGLKICAFTAGIKKYKSIK